MFVNVLIVGLDTLVSIFGKIFGPKSLIIPAKNSHEEGLHRTIAMIVTTAAAFEFGKLVGLEFEDATRIITYNCENLELGLEFKHRV